MSQKRGKEQNFPPRGAAFPSGWRRPFPPRERSLPLLISPPLFFTSGRNAYGCNSGWLMAASVCTRETKRREESSKQASTSSARADTYNVISYSRAVARDSARIAIDLPRLAVPKTIESPSIVDTRRSVFIRSFEVSRRRWERKT